MLTAYGSFLPWSTDERITEGLVKLFLLPFVPTIAVGLYVVRQLGLRLGRGVYHFLDSSSLGLLAVCGTSWLESIDVPSGNPEAIVVIITIIPATWLSVAELRRYRRSG